jgi:hypothetical protein
MAKFNLRKLSDEEIESFTSRPHVKKRMVELFLIGILRYESASNARRQLEKSALLCRWNVETIDAIEDGIILATV